MNMIHIAEEIVIERPSADVFAYVSNLTLDPTWRTEVVRMDVDGSMAVGMNMMEKSLFFKTKRLDTPGVITVYEPGVCFEFVSTEGADLPLTGRREVTKSTENQTRLKYRLDTQYDGSRVSSYLTEQLYSHWVRGYLKRLKTILEI